MGIIQEYQISNIYINNNNNNDNNRVRNNNTYVNKMKIIIKL